MTRNFRLVALLSTALLLGGCGAGEKWTVLVYMVADNNLEPFALADLEEMAEVGSGGKLDLVVQVDRAAGYTEAPVLDMESWTNTRRLRVGFQSLELVESMGEANMGQTQTLSDFLAWGIERYPADRYALVFWDHGGSWPGFGGDDSTGDQDLLDLNELRAGVAQGLAPSGRRLDLVGFDACLMGTYEVAQAMRPHADYLLASEELEPGHGWDYRDFAALSSGAAPDVPSLATTVLSGFKAQAQAFGTAANITLSLVDLSELEGLELGIEALNDAYLAGLGAMVGRERVNTLSFGEAPDPLQATHMVDLGHLSKNLAAATPVFAAARAQISAGLASAVRANTFGPVTREATGLSIYFPPQVGYYRSAYDEVPGVAGWRGFLATYFATDASAYVPKFVTTDHLVTPSFSAAGMTVTSALQSGAAGNIAQAVLTFGFPVSADPADGVYLLGDQTAGFDAAEASATWDLSVLALSQGATSGYGFISIEEQGGGTTQASIAFAYYEGPADQSADYVIRKLVFEGDALTQDRYYVIREGIVGELIPVVGSQLMPLVFHRNAAGQLSAQDGAGGYFSPEEPIVLSAAAFATGDVVYARLDITNFAGQGDFVATLTTVP
jgi:hypothetical protein